MLTLGNFASEIFRAGSISNNLETGLPFSASSTDHYVTLPLMVSLAYEIQISYAAISEAIR